MALKPGPVAGRSWSAPGAGGTGAVGTAARPMRRWSVSSSPSRRRTIAKAGATWSSSTSGCRKPFGSTALRLPRNAGRSTRHSRNINTSLPWEHRILLGADISEPVAVEDVPDDEIHIHFTDGKALWPEGEGEEYTDDVLGIGGTRYDREQRALGGYTYVDRYAVGRGETRMEFVVAHELLHAWGMNAHADPRVYPDVLLVPHLPRNLDEVPRLWLTVEGEALLAAIDIAPGTPLSDLAVADLGPWEDDGFHVAGQTGLGRDGCRRNGVRGRISQRPWQALGLGARARNATSGQPGECPDSVRRPGPGRFWASQARVALWPETRRSE